MLAMPANDFGWSSWPDVDAAVREVDGLIAELTEGRTPEQLCVSVLFAPTGPIQEVSISSGWGHSFLDLAAQFDAAERALYGSNRQ